MLQLKRITWPRANSAGRGKRITEDQRESENLGQRRPERSGSTARWTGCPRERPGAKKGQKKKKGQRKGEKLEAKPDEPASEDLCRESRAEGGFRVQGIERSTTEGERTGKRANLRSEKHL